MPFYEYECTSCKAHTEALQKVSDAPLRKCPSCGRNTLKKLISAPIFRLKGGGWYETDFKSDKENKRNLAVEKDSESKASDDAPKAKTGDAKPADAKPAETKSSEAKPAEKSGGDSGSSGSSSSSGSSRSSARRKQPAKSKPRAKPAAKRRTRR